MQNNTIAPDRSPWEARIYFPAAKSLTERFSQEYRRATPIDGVMAEDGGIFEKTQSMLASGAKRHLQLGDEELLIRHHLAMVERSVGAW